MRIFQKLFCKKKTKENIKAHAIVDQKAGEAHDILNEVQSKLLQVSNEIEFEQKRTRQDMERKIEKIRDVAAQIAYVTSGGGIS